MTSRRAPGAELEVKVLCYTAGERERRRDIGFGCRRSRRRKEEKEEKKKRRTERRRSA